MPEEHREGRTTETARWLHTPKNLARLAAFTKAAEARARTVGEGQQPEQSAKDAGDAARHQHHTTQPDQGKGGGDRHRQEERHQSRAEQGSAPARKH